MDAATEAEALIILRRIDARLDRISITIREIIAIADRIILSHNEFLQQIGQEPRP